jgi:cytochrome c peroxidase
VRTDAVNWDLLNDGIGNPKSTKSLLFAHYTPPAMVSGIRADAETAVRAGFRHIQFSMPDEDKALAIDAFLKSLTSIPSPHLVDGKLSEAARRGKVLFDGIGECIYCHSGTYYTNQKQYDVGTGADNEDGTKFDVPMLREIWRTAPYLYDGRAATLKDAFRLFNPKDRHGTTSELSDEELDDLIEYVLSL